MLGVNSLALETRLSISAWCDEFFQEPVFGSKIEKTYNLTLLIFIVESLMLNRVKVSKIWGWSAVIDNLAWLKSITRTDSPIVCLILRGGLTLKWKKK